VQRDLALGLGDLRPDIAASRLASVTGSRSMRTSSRLTGTVCWTCSVTTYLRSRARPAGSAAVPTRICSSERVIASSACPAIGPPACVSVSGTPVSGTPVSGTPVSGTPVSGTGLGQAGGAGLLAVGQAVVAEQLGLLGRGQLAVRVDLRRAGDGVLAGGQLEDRAVGDTVSAAPTSARDRLAISHWTAAAWLPVTAAARFTGSRGVLAFDERGSPEPMDGSKGV
jgi:hypothetical protein